MQGTVIMLLALSGLGCHHKSCEPAYTSGCYSSCYSNSYSSSSCYSSGYSGYSSCYSSSCYSGGSSSCYSSGYSSCYSSGYSSCYSGGSSSCYSSSCYSAKRHHHGLFGHKRNRCQTCCEPAPVMSVSSGCDTCSNGYGSMPVYGTYTPVYEGYASSQMPSSQYSSGQPPMSSSTDAAPTMAPSVPETGGSSAMPMPAEAGSGSTPPPPPAPVAPSGF